MVRDAHFRSIVKLSHANEVEAERPIGRVIKRNR